MSFTIIIGRAGWNSGEIELSKLNVIDFPREKLKLVAAVDYISKKNGIPLNNDYSAVRSQKLSAPYYVGDSSMFANRKGIEEFERFNIHEGDLYDAV